MRSMTTATRTTATRIVALAAFAIQGAAGCGDDSLAPGGPDAQAGAEAGAWAGDGAVSAFWTFAVIPDTQYSYYASPPFFDAETSWIAANYQAENIAFVLHAGDIVDAPLDPGQWAVARASMAPLDGKVPYVLAAGNHDLALAGKPEAPRTTLLNDAFPYAELAASPTFGGAFETGHRENAYYLLPGGGRTWDRHQPRVLAAPRGADLGRSNPRPLSQPARHRGDPRLPLFRRGSL